MCVLGHAHDMHVHVHACTCMCPHADGRGRVVEGEEVFSEEEEVELVVFGQSGREGGKVVRSMEAHKRHRGWGNGNGVME